ncbi:preprotein translocase subunit YajC, partial [Helicobacter rodentium]
MENIGNTLTQLLPLIVLIAIFYLLIIRPQQTQARKHKEMIASLDKGDKVVTSGGFIVEIVKRE